MTYNYEYEQSFLSNSHKQIHILYYGDYAYKGYISSYPNMHLTNENLVKEQFRLEEKISDSDNIEFGSMYASMLEFTVRASTCPNQLEFLKTHKGIKVLINFGLNNSMYYNTLFYLGNYIVTDMEYVNGEDEVKITAYDPMIVLRDLDIAPWLKSKWGDTSTNANDDKRLGDLLNDLASDLIRGNLWSYDNKPYEDDDRMNLLQYIGFEANYGSIGDLINYDMKVSYPSTVEALSLGDFLKSVAELNGCCMHYISNRQYFETSSGYTISNPLGFIEFLNLKTYASPEGQEADHIIYNRYRQKGETKLKNYITPKIKKIRAFNASGEWISTFTKGWKKKNAIYSIDDNLFLRDYNRMVQKQTIYNSDELITQVWQYYPGSQMMQGDECKSIQTVLNNLGLTPAIQVDGKYGVDTENGVKWFQEGYVDPDDPTHTLEATGIVDEETALALGFMFELGAQYAPGGADTWPQIERALKYVKNGALMEGEDVLNVQKALNNKGSQFSVVENGIYNAQTRDAVKAWQVYNSMSKQNGRVADQEICASLSLTWNPYVKDEEVVGAVHDALENIYNSVNDNRYIPFAVKCVGNPCMNIGEKLSVYDQTREKKVNKSYCLHRVLSGIQMMVDEVEAKGVEEKETFAVYNSSASGSTSVSGGSPTSVGNVETLMSDGSVYGLDQINFIELVRNLGFRFPNEPTKVKVVEGENGDMTVKFKWTDPANITNEKPQKSKWAGTVVVRKAGSAPLHRWDFKKATGGVLTEYTGKANKSKYKDTFLVDDGTVLPPRVQGQTYYYGIFPYDENGHYRYTKVIKIGGSDKDDTYVEAYVGSVGGPNRYVNTAINISRYSSISTYKVVLKSGSIPVSETDGIVFEAPPSAYGKVLVSDEIQRPGNYGIAAFEHLNNGSVVAIPPFPELVYFGNIDPDMIVKIDRDYGLNVVSDEDPTVNTNYYSWQNMVNNASIDGYRYGDDYLLPYPDSYTTMYYYVWKLKSCYAEGTTIRTLTYDYLNSLGNSGGTFCLDYTRMVNKALSIKLKQLYFYSAGVHDYPSEIGWDFIGSPGFALCTLDPNYYNDQCVYAFGMTFRTDRCPVSDGKRIFRGVRTKLNSSGTAMQIANAFEYVSDSVNPANNIPVRTAYDFEYIINLGSYDSETHAIDVNSIVELVDDEVVANYDMTSSGIKIFLGGNGAGMFFLQSGSVATGYGPEGETYGQTWRCEGVEFKYCDTYNPSPTGEGLYLNDQLVCSFDQLEGLNANYSNVFDLAYQNGYVDLEHNYDIIFGEPTTTTTLDPDLNSDALPYGRFVVPEGWTKCYVPRAKYVKIPASVNDLGNFGNKTYENVDIDPNNTAYDSCGNIIVKLPQLGRGNPQIVSVCLTADWDTFNTKYTSDVEFTQYAFSRVVSGSNAPDAAYRHKPFVWKPNMIINYSSQFSSRFEDFKISSEMTVDKYKSLTNGKVRIFNYYQGPFPVWEDGSHTIPVIHDQDFANATIEAESLYSGETLDLSGLTDGIGSQGFMGAVFKGYTKFVIGIDDGSAPNSGIIQNNAFKNVIINSNLTKYGNVEFEFNNVTFFGDLVLSSNYTSGNWPNIKSIKINRLHGGIGSSAFYGLDYAHFDVNLASGSSGFAIGSAAFANASINATDKTLTIPLGFTTIANDAFRNVNHVYYYGTATGSPWGAKNIN